MPNPQPLPVPKVKPLPQVNRNNNIVTRDHQNSSLKSSPSLSNTTTLNTVSDHFTRSLSSSTSLHTNATASSSVASGSSTLGSSSSLHHHHHSLSTSSSNSSTPAITPSFHTVSQNTIIGEYLSAQDVIDELKLDQFGDNPLVNELSYFYDLIDDEEDDYGEYIPAFVKNSHQPMTSSSSETDQQQQWSAASNLELESKIDEKLLMNQLTSFNEQERLTGVRDLKLLVKYKQEFAIFILPQLFSIYGSTLEDEDHIKQNYEKNSAFQILQVITYISDQYQNQCKSEYSNHFYNMLHILAKRQIPRYISNKFVLKYYIKLLYIFMPSYYMATSGTSSSNSTNNVAKKIPNTNVDQESTSLRRHDDLYEFNNISFPNYIKFITLNSVLFNACYYPFLLKSLQLTDIELNTDEVKCILQYFYEAFIMSVGKSDSSISNNAKKNVDEVNSGNIKINSSTKQILPSASSVAAIKYPRKYILQSLSDVILCITTYHTKNFDSVMEHIKCRFNHPIIILHTLYSMNKKVFKTNFGSLFETFNDIVNKYIVNLTEFDISEQCVIYYYLYNILSELVKNMNVNVTDTSGVASTNSVFKLFSILHKYYFNNIYIKSISIQNFINHRISHEYRDTSSTISLQSISETLFHLIYTCIDKFNSHINTASGNGNQGGSDTSFTHSMNQSLLSIILNYYTHTPTSCSSGMIKDNGISASSFMLNNRYYIQSLYRLLKLNTKTCYSFQPSNLDHEESIENILQPLVEELKLLYCIEEVVDDNLLSNPIIEFIIKELNHLSSSSSK
ncbi:hypothetical protein C9374_009157 [Naegleria lovaniensis]|uniref:Uncharacterized protein n=1 Tax=Naegleria lovaniensis TaxID=51637 RepID=A0AA88GI64_NAELO|nr:uncharacterized protein C9374_009157 [Naegleria lovaniensis]KAG2377641.1 hypothetical protein C9374_009157 [Naegleria lovaniensis]